MKLLKPAWWLAMAVAAAACLLLCGPYSVAFADDAYDAGNGWSLSYSAAEGQVTITGAEQAGSGALVIPAEIAGQPVTGLANDAFRGSAVASVQLPASLEGVSAGCFRDCASLADVSFEGGATGYLGSYAFANCTSLTAFTVPVLSFPSKDYNGVNENYRIGKNCFLGCANLEKVEFLSNGKSTDNYFTTYSVPVMESNNFGGCDKLRTFVFYGKRNNFERWLDTPEGTNWYYTVNFFASKEDATDYSKKVASVTCVSETPIAAILDGTVEPNAVYAKDGEIPALPAGKAWGLSDHERQADDWGLYNSCNVYPVDADDLDYGWVTSPEIKDLTDKGWQDVYWDYERAVFSLNKAGNAVPGIAGIIVHGPDGSVVDPSSYSIELEARIMGSGGIYTPDYEKTNAITSAGLYRVRAVASGASSHAGSATDYVEMNVVPFSMTTKKYATADDGAYAVAGTHRGSSAYAVVAPSSSWQYAMIGVGLAAAGNGVVASSAADTISSTSLRAIIANGADSVLVLGAGTQIDQSVINQINGQTLFANGGGVTALDATSVQDMAVQAYNSIAKYGASRFEHTAAWGTSAVVMSPENCFDTAYIAQYALAKKAPVFFTDDSGALPSSVASILASGAFEEVVVPGSASLVPDSTIQQIGSSVANVKRIAGPAAGSGAESRAFADAYAVELGLNPAKVVVASMDDVLNVVLGAQVAVDNGAVMYTCASTEDGKQVQALMDAANAQASWLVGSFDAVDAKLAARVASVATANPESTTVGKGDTIEQEGVVYQLAGSGKVSMQDAFDKSATALTVPNAVKHGPASYTVSSFSSDLVKSFKGLKTLDVAAKAVTSIPASAFSGMTKLKSVSYAAAVASIGKSAFSGCSALTTLNANVLKTAKLGTWAFKSCKSLKKAAFTNKKLTSVPENAFWGCAKLASVSYAAAVASIGKSAFSGCRALSTLNANVLKASTIGSSAFKGCKNLKKVTLSSAKLAVIPASAFANCTKLSSVQVSSKKLKSIGASAFSGCKKLKTIVLGTSSLKKAKVGKDALKGIASSAKVKVPKKKVAAYAKIFAAKGLPKNAKVIAG